MDLYAKSNELRTLKLSDHVALLHVFKTCRTVAEKIKSVKPYRKIWHWTRQNLAVYSVFLYDLDAAFWKYPNTVERFFKDVCEIFRVDILDLLKQFQIPIIIPCLDVSLMLFAYATLRERVDLVGASQLPRRRIFSIYAKNHSLGNDDLYDSIVSWHREDKDTIVKVVLQRYKECRTAVYNDLDRCELEVLDYLIMHRKKPVLSFQDLRNVIVRAALPLTEERFLEEEQNFIRDYKKFQRRRKNPYFMRKGVKYTYDMMQQRTLLYKKYRRYILRFIYGRIYEQYEAKRFSDFAYFVEYVADELMAKGAL